jgi:hypothetical protein
VPELIWQDVFTTQFPHGLVMRWLDDTTSPRYPVEQVEVVEVIDRWPLVHLEVTGAAKAFDFQITRYRVIELNPLVAWVSGMRIPDMLWTANTG